MAAADDRRLLRLTVGHLVLGVVAAVIAPIELPDLFGLSKLLPPFGLTRLLIALLIAFVLCQAVLLGLWGAFSGTSVGRRTVGLAAGAFLLEVLLSGASLHGEFLGLSTLTIAVTTATLLAARALGVRLVRQEDSSRSAPADVDGFRFSIRDLMLLVAAVAVLSACARTLQEVLPHSGTGILLVTAVWGLCFIAVGLIALWAELGEVRSPYHEAAVLASSPLLGGFIAVAARAHPAGVFYIVLTMFLYAAFLLGSLRIVRSCGSRFVRRGDFVPEPADADASF